MYADNDDIDNELNSLKSPLLVSLGSHCETAGMMRAYQIRRVAFPFDWLLTLDHDRFLNILEEDFLHFLDMDYFFRHPKYPSVLENTYYEVEFRHDWSFPDFNFDQDRFTKQLQEINDKYTRRITRFRQIGGYHGKVVFIRSAFDFNNDPNVYWGKTDQSRVTFEQALSLKVTLDQYFPNLNFTLVILNYVEDYVPKIEGIKGVLEFKIRKTHKHEDYQKMFEILKKL